VKQATCLVRELLASPSGSRSGTSTSTASSGCRLSEAWSVPFEVCRPVRRFASYKGQRNHIGQ
jgi:hypothetical protein